MKKFLLILPSTLLIVQLFAQNYDHVIYKHDFEPVYELVIDSFQYKKAIKCWEKLNLKYQDSVHTEEYMLRAFCYYQLGKKNKAAKCVKEAWCHQLCDPAYLSQINGFKWSLMVSSFNSKQMKRVEEGYKINLSLNSKNYDSLAYLIKKISTSDQTYRSFLTEEERIKYADSLTILAVRRDSLDMLEFLRIYDKYGFPGERVSCLFSQRFTVFMLHTADYDWFYTKMKLLFEEDVRRGRMPSSLFLMWIDRHSRSNELPAEYAMYQNPNDFHPTPEELEIIKRKRFEKGVSKLCRIPNISD
nr:hypothetical protein [uncultured Fluviicola sp.]